MAQVSKAFFDQSQTVNGEGDYTDASIPYIAFDASDEEDAISGVRAAADAAYNGLVIDTVEIDERINDSTFRVIVAYRKPDYVYKEGASEPEPVYSFDTGGSNYHLTRSISTSGKYPSSAPDYEGAIRYNKYTDTVEGVDIFVPSMSFSETHYFSDEKFTTQYKKGIAYITGTINKTPFRGYERGEVLFLGASGSKKGNDSDALWEITFKFSVAPNRRNFSVGKITVSEKYGWDYMWVLETKKTGSSRNSILTQAEAVYIERVYQISEFGNLGIGN